MCPTAHFVSGEAEKIGYPYRYRSRCQPKSYRTLNLGKTDITDLFSLGKTDKIYYFCLGKTDKTDLFPLGKTDKDMIKRKIDSYLEHFFEQNKKALLLTGARQIGKTFSIRRLGHEHFEHFVEINFIESPNLVSVFSKATSSQDILLRLSTITKQDLVKGKTLVFFDEVQECPELVTAIKFLVEEGSYRYILSGSLLGVEIKNLRSAPVGFMTIKDMYPLDFEEFASALGINDKIIQMLKEHFNKGTAVDEFIHKKMMETFRLYLIVGGMPSAVVKYLDTNNLQEVMEEQRSIVRLYKQDIAKYDPDHKLYIEEIFERIPAELDAKNKRFILKNLNENLKFSRYQNSFLWLKDAGVALPVYNVEEPKVPLIISCSRNLFKLFMGDIGLLASLYADGIQLKILDNEPSINFGSIYENAVAQELCAHGFPLYYYNSKRQGELDFVIEQNGEVLPLEVKSGKDYERHKALSNVLNSTTYKIPRGYVLCNDNVKQVGKVTYLPIYMTMFIQKEQQLPTNYKIDLSGLLSC